MNIASELIKIAKLISGVNIQEDTDKNGIRLYIKVDGIKFATPKQDPSALESLAVRKHLEDRLKRAVHIYQIAEADFDKLIDRGDIKVINSELFIVHNS